MGQADDLPTLLARRVDLRFSLDGVAFARRVREIAAGMGMDPVTAVARLRLDDLYLSTACAAGDAAAWEECGSCYFKFIRDFARRFLPDAAARDLADQVIADLWNAGKMRLFEGRSSLKTWLGTLVAHSALNRLSGKAPPVSLDVRGTAMAKDPSVLLRPEAAQSAELLSALVKNALRELPAEERLLLQLYYEQGLTLEEMEVAMRVSKATLSRRLQRLRARLKQAVDRAARESYGMAADALRDGVDLARLELDLEQVLGGTPTGKSGRGSV